MINIKYRNINMSKTNKSITIAAIVLLLILAFAFLDPGIRTSATYSDSVVSSYSIGSPEGIMRNDITLYVHQEEPLDGLLQKELHDALEDAGFSVTIADDILDRYDSQFVFVRIIDTKKMYTPIYSGTEMDIRFGFSSTGKTRYMNIEGEEIDRPIVFTSDDTGDKELLIIGRISMEDRTKGLFTYRAYDNHISAEIAKSVASELDPHTKTGI